jgi:hypothetical protein
MMMTSTRRSIAAALLAAAILAQEVIAGRLLSVITWYSLGFLALSLGLLGMTAGALLLHLRPRWFAAPRTDAACSTAAAASALLVVLCTLWLVRTRVDLQPDAPLRGVADALWVSVVIALPFVGTGAALAALLSQAERPGQLYAADLLGAAAGALAAGPAIAWLGAPHALAGTGALLAAAAAVLHPGRVAALALAPLLVLAVPDALDIRWAKDRPLDAVRPFAEGWTSFSHVRAEEHRDLPPFYWGPLDGAPMEPVEQLFLRIDGAAGTPIYSFQDPRRDLAFLRHDVTYAPFAVRPPARVLVLGVGGGRDLLAAHVAGATTVHGAEINGLLVDWLRGVAARRSPVLGLPGVAVEVEDARAFAARSSQEYDLILASLVDTWAATGAGALSLTEHSLYTREAWALFLRRLSDRGVLAFSRWYTPAEPMEVARLAELGRAALADVGVTDWARHHILLAKENVAVLLVSRTPFTAEELARVETGGARRLEAPVLSEEDRSIDVSPPTDDRPFFFLQVPLSAWLSPGTRARVLASGDGLLHGNLVALGSVALAFLVATALAVVWLLLPLLGLGRAMQAIPPTDRFRVLGYFGLLGLGFMLFELATAQRLSLMLGNPTWALALTLAPLTLGAGAGAWLAERRAWPPARMALVSAAAVLLGALGGLLTGPLLTLGPAARASACAALVAQAFPLGALLPAGIRHVQRQAPGAVAWCWGVNGLTTVAASGAAIFISVSAGISTTFLVAGAAYLLVAALARRWPAR